MPTIFFDFDSTVCTKESLDEVIALALSEHPNQLALVQKVEDITNRGMNGEIDFMQSAEERLAICPLNRSHFEIVGKKLTQHITPGFKDLFSGLIQSGWEVYIVSGGFLPSVLPAAHVLGLDVNKVFANGLRSDENGNIGGVDTSGLLWTNRGKTPVIEFLSDSKKLPRPLVLVGDGSNDLAAFKAGAVDHFVGFGGNVVRDKVQKQSPLFARKTEELTTHLQKIN